MGFFDNVKTSFDDEIVENKETETGLQNQKKIIEKSDKKIETGLDSNIEKSETKSAPKAVISDGSKGNQYEDDFLSALNQNIVISDKPEKIEEKEEKKCEEKKEIQSENKSENNSIFQDQFEEKTEKIETLKTNISSNSEISIDEILDLAIENKVSDIHFSEGGKISLRIDGGMRFVNEINELSKETVFEYVSQLMGNEKDLIARYQETKEMDCAYEHPSGTNFRVNLFFKRKKMAAVLRKIESKAMKLEDLGIPESIKKLLTKKQGLLLVTGPTGSGKSTSMQSMLQYINEHRVEHILTIEDPIEFIFKNDKSIFSQREVGTDTKSFHNALKAALREDPDIIMIGEMRDQETINAAMHLAETGHLVISTLHTSSAAQTISRLVSTYPSEEQSQVQSRLADSLIGVLSQRLVKRNNEEGRIGIYEVLIVNNAVRNIIRTGDMGQMGNAMLSGRSEGMITMQDHAENLASDGIILHESFQGFFKSE